MAVNGVHVDNAIAIIQPGLDEPVRHDQGRLDDVKQILAHILPGVGQANLIAVAQHAPGHFGVIVVLNFDMQDETACRTAHQGDEIRVPIFDALIVRVDDFRLLHLEVQQNLRNVDRNAFEDVFGNNILGRHEFSGVGGKVRTAVMLSRFTGRGQPWLRRL